MVGFFYRLYKCGHLLYDSDQYQNVELKQTIGTFNHKISLNRKKNYLSCQKRRKKENCESPIRVFELRAPILQDRRDSYS